MLSWFCVTWSAFAGHGSLTDFQSYGTQNTTQNLNILYYLYFVSDRGLATVIGVVTWLTLFHTINSTLKYTHEGQNIVFFESKHPVWVWVRFVVLTLWCNKTIFFWVNYWTLSMDAIWSDDKVIGNLHTLYPMIDSCEATIAPHLDIRVSCMQNYGVYSKTTVWNPLVIILVSVFQKSQRRLYQSKARIRLYRCRFEIIQQMQQIMGIKLSASG